MNKSIVLTAATALLGFSAVVEARSSSEAELRGYNNCVAAVEKESNGLVPTREYLIDRSGDTTMYYVNATRWENGERANVRAACETAARGHRLVSATIEDGRFTRDNTRVTVEVAQN